MTPISSPRRPRQGRAGITLTEILISILIMGVGMISLATLFPLGLLRLRAASRDVRSVFLKDSAIADAEARNLLVKSSFTSTWYGGFDPMTVDPIDPTDLTKTKGLSIGGSPTPGLPVCYDPLFRALSGIKPNQSGVAEARFGLGIGLLRTDPDGSTPSAYGLQRITNLPVNDQWGWNVVDTTTPAGASTANGWLQMVGNIFASQDDLVYQQSAANVNVAQGKGNPLALDLSSGGPAADWTYTWMFTGQQSSVTNAANFDGDIVIFHNRPFAIDPTTGYTLGERVVEAIWAYGAIVSMPVIDATTGLPGGTTTTMGYSPNTTTVLLRWPSGQPDPEIRVGGWIADVTYERTAALNLSRFGTSQFPARGSRSSSTARPALPLVSGGEEDADRGRVDPLVAAGGLGLPADGGHDRDAGPVEDAADQGRLAGACERGPRLAVRRQRLPLDLHGPLSESNRSVRRREREPPCDPNRPGPGPTPIPPAVDRRPDAA